MLKQSISYITTPILMSFRKRNVRLTSPSHSPDLPGPSLSLPIDPVQSLVPAPGVRPSPLDGRLTTSTGTQSLDDLLAGHAGLALGNSILIEEDGTTDYAGALLRYYAAEGILQGHKVFVVGVTEQWGRELPGFIGPTNSTVDDASKLQDKDKMKIAWRYENLGDFGSKPSNARASQLPNRNAQISNTDEAPLTASNIFCHNFDLTKRLAVPLSNPIIRLPVPLIHHQKSPFLAIMNSLVQELTSSPPNKIHRLVIPSLLSPGLYPPQASNPSYVLQFLHSLRAILCQYPTQLTAMISLPLTLYPRSTGLVRWMEILTDGVLELAPFPHAIETGPLKTTASAAGAHEETPQGMVKVHRLPIFHEKGGSGGNGEISNDFVFTVSRRRFAIKPFSLPPVDGDTEAQRDDGVAKATKPGIDF